MTDILPHLVGHMRWADSLVAAALIDDTPAEAVRLFAHIASVEHLWYQRILGEPARYDVWPSLSARESSGIAAAHADLFDRLLTENDEPALSRIVQYRNSAGREYASAVSEIVVHTAMHGEHHRGQIARLIRAAGLEPPYTDYIQYSRRDQ